MGSGKRSVNPVAMTILNPRKEYWPSARILFSSYVRYRLSYEARLTSRKVTNRKRSFDPGQPARTEQADQGRYFLQIHCRYIKTPYSVYRSNITYLQSFQLLISFQKVYFEMYSETDQKGYRSTVRGCSTACQPRNDFMNCTRELKTTRGCIRKDCCHDSDLCNHSNIMTSSSYVALTCLILVELLPRVYVTKL